MNRWIKTEYWHKPDKLKIVAFGSSEDPLLQLSQSGQIQYIRRYLAGLKCSTVLCEPNYFDRDYLSEFAEFYCRSARGYPNICQRLHFFSGETLTDAIVDKALSGDQESCRLISDNYLGFCIIRPIPSSPLGRTVLAWYNDPTPENPRIFAKREYKVHLAGLELSVLGIAWQQQDTGVGACATIALWSAMHSSAFDEHHAVPTTAEITKAAHRTASLGERVFPSSGLTNIQILEAIKELGLAPAIEQGDQPNRGFSRRRFSALCSTFLRSGYPIIICGRIEGRSGRHAICLVGFRESPIGPVKENTVQLHGQDTNVLYIHDDNLGPNVRFLIEDRKELLAGTDGTSEYQYVALTAKAPNLDRYWSSEFPDPTAGYWSLIPDSIIVAMHNDVRTSPTTLSDMGRELAKLACAAYNFVNKLDPSFKPIGISAGTHFFKLSDYVGEVLPLTLAGSDPNILSKVRRQLWETVPPMSLFLGVVRLWHDKRPIADILFDTTDSDRNMPVFAYINYDQGMGQILTSIAGVPDLYRPIGLSSLGIGINAC